MITTKTKMDMRIVKGKLIAHTMKIENLGTGVFLVPSQTLESAKYEVIIKDDISTCTCQDYSKRLKPCKHVYAVMDLCGHGGKIPQ